MTAIVLHFYFNSPAPPDIFFFFFNDTATTEIYTLSLHDALPISPVTANWEHAKISLPSATRCRRFTTEIEEHTSELQSQSNLVCRLLLEKKKTKRSSSSTYLTTARHSRPSALTRSRAARPNRPQA